MLEPTVTTPAFEWHSGNVTPPKLERIHSINPSPAMTTDDEKYDALETAIESLSAAGSVPPSAAWDYLVEWEGEEVTRRLVDVMGGGGQAAIHAVRILGERGDTESVPTMIDLLAEGDLDKLMRDEITFAFHKFGPSVLDPLLDAYDDAEEAGDSDLMLTLLEAAFETGAVTRRLSRAFATQIEHDPALVRRMLVEYEATDQVVDHLEQRAAEIPEADASNRPDGETIQAIWNTIEQLGGDVPQALRSEMHPNTDAPPSEAEAYIRGD